MSKLINNKSDSSKVKLSLISEEARVNWKLFGCYATWLKNKTKVSMPSQTSLSQISVYIQIFIPRKHLSFEGDFNGQFNNLIIAVKLQR